MKFNSAFFIRRVRALVLLVLVFALLGLLGKLWYLFDLFSHFRLQYIACLLAAGAFFLLLKRFRPGLLCGAAALILFLPLAHYYFPRATVPHLDPIKVISFNVNSNNTNFSGIRDLLLTESADVVLLLEASPALINELQALHTVYPYRLEEPRDDNFGLVALSKYPIRKGGVRFFGEFDLPYAKFEISVSGETYHFIGIHTLPPMNGSNAASRNAELLELAQSQQEHLAENIIMMGDFNLTPFSRWYADVLHTSGLQDSLPGFGLSPTWMRSTIIFAIPIDQMFVSSSLTVLQRSIGDSCGSDHNPLIVELARKK